VNPVDADADQHANAIEARFARDQATLTARQGQTIMVFTLVTIVFLPMSFIAAFFAINVENWSGENGSGRLTVGYISKYMCKCLLPVQSNSTK